MYMKSFMLSNTICAYILAIRRKKGFETLSEAFFKPSVFFTIFLP